MGDDPPDDAFALIPIELDWRKVGGVAYNNLTTGVKITHFPVIHCRKGHIVPGNAPMGHLLQAKKGFSGQVIVGEDLMQIGV